MGHNPAGVVLMGALETTALSLEESSFFSSAGFSGVTLFGRNIPEHVPSVANLNRSVHALASDPDVPMLIAVDQEGGRVRRLQEPFPNHGPALQLADGEQTPAALAEVLAYASSVGTALANWGFNVDFAPVVDVLSNPQNPVIGDRAFGRDPAAVSLRAGAFLTGLQAAPVIGCLKHFPGHGDAAVDTHLGTAIVDADETTLLRREVRPFIELMGETKMIMVAHCIYPAWSNVPASCSPEIMQDLLRRRLGFRGVIVTDDMNMHAIPQDEPSWKQAIVDAIAAGADLLLVCRHMERCRWAYEALQQQAAASPAFAKRLEDAAQRVLSLRRYLGARRRL